MSDPTPNVALLRQTLAYIETHSEEWIQESWRCGTSMCFAGHAATLAGGQWEDETSDEMIAVAEDDPNFVLTWPGCPSTIDVEHRARRILGLTRGQAGDLFDAYNTLDGLRRIVAELTGGAS